VGRAVKHAGQTTLYLTPMHAAKDKLMDLIANIHAALSHVKAVGSSCQTPTAGGRLLTSLWPKSPDICRLGSRKISWQRVGNCRI
jgi:hypothetical protein